MTHSAPSTAAALPRPSSPPGGALGQERAMRRSAAAVPRPAVRRAAYCLAVRRYAARAPAEEECADAPTSPAGYIGGHQPGGATRGAGERSLLRQTERREKVDVRARHTLAGVHGPRVAARRCQRGQPEAQKVAELRLVTPRHPRVHANLRCYCWNVLPVCGGATACGRRPRCFASGGCEGTTLRNAFLSAFDTLSISTHVPRGCRGGRIPWRRLLAVQGTAAALPRKALSPHTPSPP